MKLSPSWEANSYSASHEITRLLWNPKFHYSVHNSTPLVPIRSQMHPVHTFPPYFPKIHSNISLPSIPRFSKLSLPFTFTNRYFVCSFISSICDKKAHLILLVLIELLMFVEEFKLIVLCSSLSVSSFLQSPITTPSEVHTFSLSHFSQSMFII